MSARKLFEADPFDGDFLFQSRQRLVLCSQLFLEPMSPLGDGCQGLLQLGESVGVLLDVPTELGELRLTSQRPGLRLIALDVEDPALGPEALARDESNAGMFL